MIKTAQFRTGIIFSIFFVFIAQMAYSQTLETYDWPTAEGEAYLSDKYRVILKYNGDTDTSEVIMSKPRESEIPNFVKEFRGGRTFSWTMFSCDFTKPLEVSVEKIFGTGSSQVEIFPSKFNISQTLSNENKKVTFTLTGPKYVSINFKSADNMHTSDGVIKHMMMVFADTVETDVPQKSSGSVHVYSSSSTMTELKSASTIYFPQGYHNLAHLGDVSNLGPAINFSGKQVYFEGGAYVHGRIYGVSGNNVKIYGRGVLSGRDFEWKTSFPPNNAHIGIGENNGGNNTITGVIVCDGAGHGINLGHHATYRNAKYWGWHPNNDGMRPWGTDNIIDRCFIRSCDDALYNKGLTVTNNVFWPSYNGSILCLGWDGKYHTENSVLRNNYVIYPEWRDIGNNHGVVMSQIDYDMHGINVEIDGLYIDGNIPALVNLHNRSSKYDEGDFDLPTDFTNEVGRVDNISFKNVFVYGKQVKFNGSGYEQTPVPSKGLIRGTRLSNGDTYFMENIVFENLVIDGICIDDDNKDTYFDIDDETTDNIDFEGCEPWIGTTNKVNITFNIYPNPTNDILTIEGAEYPVNYNLFNINGKLVEAGQGTSIDLYGLNTGFYILTIENQKFKIIKQ